MAKPAYAAIGVFGTFYCSGTFSSAKHVRNGICATLVVLDAKITLMAKARRHENKVCTYD